MIIYDREKKELIIPATFAGGGDGNCGPAVEEAYQQGWEDGFASGETSCSGGCCISAQRIVIQDDIPSNGQVIILPFDGCDGVYKGVAQISGALNKSYQSGYTNGESAGVVIGEDNIRSQFTNKNIYQNGTYTCTGDAAFSAVSVNVPQIVGYLPILSGTIILDHDVVMGGFPNCHISPWMQSADGIQQTDFDYNFVEIDGRDYSDWVGQTLTAGTHTIYADLRIFNQYQQDGFDNWYVKRINLWEDGGGTPLDGDWFVVNTRVVNN